MDGWHFCVVSLSSPPRSSTVSALFDFNASLNDAAPVSPMLFADEFNENGKEWIVDGCHLCCFFCLHHPNRVL